MWRYQTEGSAGRKGIHSTTVGIQMKRLLLGRRCRECAIFLFSVTFLLFSLDVVCLLCRVYTECLFFSLFANRLVHFWSLSTFKVRRESKCLFYLIILIWHHTHSPPPSMHSLHSIACVWCAWYITRRFHIRSSYLWSTVMFVILSLTLLKFSFHVYLYLHIYKSISIYIYISNSYQVHSCSLVCICSIYLYIYIYILYISIIHPSDGVCCNHTNSQVGLSESIKEGESVMMEVDLRGEGRERTLHFFVEGRQQKHYFTNLPDSVTFCVWLLFQFFFLSSHRSIVSSRLWSVLSLGS